MPHSDTQPRYIDLSDYFHQLNPRKIRDEYDCPLCNSRLSVSSSNTELFTCYGGCDRLEIVKHLTKGESGLTPEQQARREARAHQRIEDERARVESLKPSEQKNAEFLATLSKRNLSDKHRQDMLDRGYTPELIELSGAKSFPQGRGMPIRDYSGKIVGLQSADKGAKVWIGASGTHRLAETDELPLSVVYPTTPIKLKKGVLEIRFCESTGDKPFLAAHQLGHITVGSSNIGSQPKDLKRTLHALKAKYGARKLNCILYADAGCVVNDHVMGNYTQLHSQLKALEIDLQIGWWNQYNKISKENKYRETHGDIDEISAIVDISSIKWDKFLKISEHRKTFLELSHLDRNSTKLTSVSVIDSQYIPKFDLVPRAINLISSPCGTGKTTLMMEIVKQHLERNPGAKVIDITHIEAIRTKHNRDLGFEDWKVGFSQNIPALNNFYCVSTCLDSTLQLHLESIPNGSLLMLDEVEALLRHAAQGGTTGSRASNFQRHFGHIINWILNGGGTIIAGEDDLTDISIDALHGIVRGKYPLHLTINDYKPVTALITMFKANVGHYAWMLDDLIKAGQKVFCPSTSKTHTESQNIVLAKNHPDFIKEMLRIDAKTNGLHQDFIDNPEQYLAINPTRVLFASPKIQSGVSIATPVFDRKMQWATNTGVRDIWQQFNRVRGVVPADVFVATRGCDAGSALKNVEKYKKLEKAKAIEIVMGFGETVKPCDSSEFWNDLRAKFAVRAAISSEYLYQYYRLELVGRGYDVLEAETVVCKDFAEQIKDAKQGILIEESETIANADMKGMTEQKMNITLGSANTTYIERAPAEKFKLHLRWNESLLEPGFILRNVKQYQGKQGNAYDFRFWCLNVDLAKILDKEKIDRLQNGSHILYGQIPQLHKKAAIFSEIINDLIELAEGGEYDQETPAVKRIAAYAISHAFDLNRWFRIVLKAETTTDDGKKTNSAVATVNKLLRLIGYKMERTSQRRTPQGRLSCYTVINADCPDAAAIIKCLNAKYANYVPKMIERVERMPDPVMPVADLSIGMDVEFDGEVCKVVAINRTTTDRGVKEYYKVAFADGQTASATIDDLRRTA
jgi:hypothetical protein